MLPKILLSLTTSCLVSQTLKIRRMKKDRIDLVDNLVVIHESAESFHRQLTYCVHLLNENGIELDEFDQIALPDIQMKELS